MIIKKYVGKTEEEAAEAAKKELGGSAVIMNVRDVKPSGWRRLFQSKQVEVTAALEEEQDAYTPVRREAAKAQANQPKATLLSEKVSDMDNGLEGSSKDIEKKLESLQNLLVTQLKKSETEKNQAREEEEEQIPKHEGSDKQGDREENKEQEKFIRLLYNTMLDNEVDERYANQILEDIDKTRKPNTPIDYILTNVYQKMILKFGRAEGIKPAAKGPKVVLFLGPTGVGKTTTIAKIASSYSVGEKKNIALLTADTYRIAAAEQLRTYANILEVPFQVIYTKEELQKAISDFESFDYIFVDTAGHSHQNEEQLEKTSGLLKAVEEMAEYQAFLVLSATTKYSDLLRIAESYKTITKYQLIFTKLDETAAFGNLMNLKLYTDAPIAFVTCGQNVPDDIEQFNPQKTVKSLLGGKRG